MRHIYRHLILIVAIVLLITAQIFPIDKKLKKAKDLAGGTTLVYQVDIRQTDPPDTMGRVIELLKRRVDPNGVLDITITSQGTNRIEITMPLATEATRKLRDDYEAALDRLVAGAVNADQLLAVLSKPASEREADIERISGGDAKRKESLLAASKAYDAYSGMRTAHEANKAALQKAIEDAATAVRQYVATPNADPARTAQLQQALTDAHKASDDAARAVAQAELEYERARDVVMTMGVSRLEIKRAVERSDKDVLPKGGGEAVPSPQARALARLKATHPGIEKSLDDVLEAYRRYQRGRSTLDDPQDLVRLLKGAGVLSFRIVVEPGQLPDEARLRQELRTGGPRAVRGGDVKWYKLNKLEQWYRNRSGFDALNTDPGPYFIANFGMVVESFDGELYVLLDDSPGKRLTQAEGDWGVANSRQGPDQMGLPGIHFTMTDLGGDRMAALTSANIGRKMAILLDDEVYSAPNLLERIAKNGVISGNFTSEDIRYITRVLNAGSLAQKLSPEPISTSTIAPSFGADNLDRGLKAGVISFVAVAGFMTVYYFGCGLIAVLALAINGILILGIMAMNHAAFSLPGIAGVVLTFGMAVDANVLIYERMREEIERGADWRSAVRMGYSKAMNSIVDGNVTTLIVVMVLAFLGTQEIKGFAITMIIGSLTTMFTQLYVTRVLFSLLVDKFKWRSGSMLAVKFPWLAKALQPNIDWMKYRWPMLGFSAALVIASFIVVGARGVHLLENDFRGGTRVTIQLGHTPEGTSRVLTRAEAEERVSKAASAVTDPALADLRDPDVLVVNPAADGVSASKFVIKTTATDTAGVERIVEEAFKDVVDTPPALEFAGKGETDPSRIPVMPVVTRNLRDIVDSPRADVQVADFVGGAAVILRDINPPQTLKSLEDRLGTYRRQPAPEISRTLGLPERWVIIDGDEKSVRSAVLLVSDPAVSYLSDEAGWRTSIAVPQWRIVSDALGTAQTLSSVESFSAAIARTFTAQALVATLISALLIIIYIWVRFQSLRYAVGSIFATAHDCIVAVGAIAICAPIVAAAPGLAAALGLQAFKVDLNVVAAVLTILGYSLNDTVIVMDRIREHRGRLPYATRDVVNRAVNETISRTVITAGLTLIATLMLYIFGGEAVRAFAFTFIIGILTGTYSSIFVAAPLVWVRRYDPTEPGGKMPEVAEAGLNGTAAATESRRLAAT